MSNEDSPPSDPQTRLNAERLRKRLVEARRSISDEGRPEAVQQQHSQGKLTARERIDYLCDGGSFNEIGALAAPAPSTPETSDWTREDAPADGIVTGTARIDGQPVTVMASDYTVKGGSIGHTGSRKMSRLFDIALQRGLPTVLLHDGGGHRIQEGLDARPFAHGDDGDLFTKLTKLSGWVPLVSAIMGPGFAGPTNFSAFCDFVPVVEGTGTMGIAGPALTNAALGIDVSKEELGGAAFQTRETGVADMACEDDEACLDAVREYLSYLPQNATESPPAADESAPPRQEQADELAEIIPADPKKAFDVYTVVEGLVDRDTFFELKPRFARSIVTGFARLDGTPVGVVANNPRSKAGTLDTDATTKSSRFIALCDAFELPLVFLADVPGFLPGPTSEREGLARHSGKLVYQIERATTPVMSIVLRRGYGLGYLAMAGGRTRNELNAVWPTTELAAMGIEGAVNVIYRREIETAENPDEKREELVDRFVGRSGALRAAEGMGIDRVVTPEETRPLLIDTIDRAQLRTQEDWPPKKHGIPPI
ncbi:acyl-CoA carboxylase subunit beta [Haloglomus litoreum]|uniref:acyl-CoA carboxylase subunit beta n=1 Tax=Haloglomus litoreum TaxID=3034026 RepID=UPI0023E7C988|nr:acyl-CoA carboxylase subunit beta [Haloglomus sp. DT116]